MKHLRFGEELHQTRDDANEIGDEPNETRAEANEMRDVTTGIGDAQHEIGA